MTRAQARTILIAPNAFKGSIEADEAAEILVKAWSEKYPQDTVVSCPIADGGDGTCWLLGKALQLKQIQCWTVDPIGRTIQGFYFWDEINQAAYLDVSTVSGIKHLSQEELNPWIASSFGTGDLIKHAINQGVKTIYLGLGGSASVDIGLGILGGLGFQFLDEKGRILAFFTDTFFEKIAFIQSPIPFPNIRLELICDVDNSFFGSQGAIPVFGPQKGLLDTEIERFENCSKRIISLFEQKSKKNLTDQPSFGAAGGIGFGLSFFFDVRIHKGAQYFFQLVKLEEEVAQADLIITGEGRYDSQSAGGKGSYELLQLAKKYQKPCWLITSGDEGLQDGFDNIIKLPSLDFSNSAYRSVAKKNLRAII
ncbi:MAG: glycerate kinase family protein [Mongoliitalea sp.]